MTYEDYMEMLNQTIETEDGFCPFSRKPCMGEACGIWDDGCGLIIRNLNIYNRKLSVKE